jgi:hypothetical protein
MTHSPKSNRKLMERMRDKVDKTFDNFGESDHPPSPTLPVKCESNFNAVLTYGVSRCPCVNLCMVIIKDIFLIDQHNRYLSAYLTTKTIITSKEK